MLWIGGSNSAGNFAPGVLGVWRSCELTHQIFGLDDSLRDSPAMSASPAERYLLPWLCIQRRAEKQRGGELWGTSQQIFWKKVHMSEFLGAITVFGPTRMQQPDSIHACTNSIACQKYMVIFPWGVLAWGLVCLCRSNTLGVGFSPPFWVRFPHLSLAFANEWDSGLIYNESRGLPGDVGQVHLYLFLGQVPCLGICSPIRK